MTTQILRPNATISSPFTVTGAASGHAALSDDSDASYIGTFTSGNADFNSGTFTLPAGAVTSLARVRIRARYSGSSGTIEAKLLKGGIASESITSASLLQTPTASFAELTGVWAGVTLTQADIDGLIIRTNGQSSTGVQIAEAYADIRYVTIPVVTVTAVTPDPYTASNQVPVYWTNSLDADGGPQSRYWVKVFTAAQYGAGGFDPETSTPTWDSGEKLSTITAVGTGPLATATTYRAYVKTAQTVNGSPHWSAWAFDQFQVSVTTSDVDTVTTVAGSFNITVTVNRDTGTSAWDFIEVQRSTDFGDTWTNVRGATYVAPDSANTHNVIDRETPNGVSTTYRARATRIVSGETITGEWVESSPDSWTSTLCYIKAPLSPTFTVSFTMGARDPYGRVRRSGSFDVLGASAPIVLSDVLSTRSGVLTVETYSASDAANLLALLDEAQVILVQFPASMDIDDCYMSVTNIEERFVSANADNLWRVWSLSYIEVDSPADPLASAP